jgi:hypothetical protein
MLGSPLPRAPWQILSLAVVLAAAALACGGGQLTKAFKTSTAASSTPRPRAATAASSTPSPPSGIAAATETVGEVTRRTLRSVRIPLADPLDLARRLGGLTLSVPPTIAPPAAPLRIGAVQRFWITNEDDEAIQVRAVLREVTDHAYFWIHDEVAVNGADLRALAETFEQDIYPTNRAFFGSEPNPGIDGDPHMYILYTRRVGLDVAGYSSSGDLVHPQIDPYSNGHEMFVLNADAVDLDDPFTYGVLAHEFQHLIHWNIDRDESLWMNEGYAELAVRLNKLDPGGLEFYYLDDTDLQLNDWPNSEFTEPHYGASYLFLSYLFDRFGRDFSAALAADPENGLDSLDRVLSDFGLSDPRNGEPLTADSVVLDWAVANLLNETGGIYGYLNPSDYLPAEVTETLDDCGPAPLRRDVRQYGVDTIRLTCPGRRSLHFEGDLQTELWPVDAHSGRYSFWSNKGDEADMTLTREFDLSGLSGPVNLSYWTWYDIEQHWDYAYVLASLDGQRWDILTTPSGTDRNPTGNSYGWGYTGVSSRGRWIEEQVDLSPYAGSTILVRFEYVTDGAVFGEGMLIDDLSIPALGYSSDFERDDGGWEAQGFVWVRNELPQGFRLALVRYGDRTEVEPIGLDSDNQAEIQLDLRAGEEAVLVVIGTTRFTRQPASYSLSFLP